MTARDEVLARIRTALADRPAAPPIPRAYRGAGSSAADLDQFAERVVDYRATVRRAAAGDVAATISDAVGDRRVVAPEGFPSEWLPPDLDVVREPLTTTELDTCDGTITTCALAIAETGTVVLDAGPGQGPRALSLVPDYLLVVVRAEQVRAGVPDAIAGLDPTRPLTWISGPSATSDIELNRVEGVHGPRTLDVIIVG
ncbi:MAG TPA: LUD domain-containing protein [Jatrophihabitantaceae bacterium]|jgi:L-lactate dehydrogenase complex protein LldG